MSKHDYYAMSTKNMKELEVLKTILYFSIFKHPINETEVFEFANISNQLDVNKQIKFLVQKGVIFKLGDYYSSINDHSLVKRRLEGNQMAENIMPKAFNVGRLIAKFPYVESVNLSGALSKGYYDNEGDIDFFIITKSSRLWIARTLLILYKKIFLLNSKKYFCVNYFIANDQLEINERNRFTATEMITLIPVSGKHMFFDFMNSNTWIKNYFPNSNLLNVNVIEDVKKSSFTELLEYFLSGSIGNFFEKAFRKITLKKWESKFKHLEKEDFKIAMKSTKSVSKHHPQNFQKKVIHQLNKDYQKIKQEHNLEVPLEHA